MPAPKPAKNALPFSAYVIPFGKYRDQSVGQIGGDDEGLLYLDWLVGQRWLKDETREAIQAYIQFPANADAVEAAVERKKERKGRL